MIAVKYLLLCTALLAWLSVIGYPLRRLLDRPSGPLAPVPAPFIGMAVVQVVGWYWFEAGRSGLRVPVIGLTVVALVASVVTVVRDQRLGRRVDRRRVSTFAASYLGAAVVIGINFSAVLGLGYLTTADSGNNDAINYATVADHLVHQSFDDHGPVVGFDMGREARQDGFGSTVVLGSLSALIGADTVKLNGVVLFTFAALTVYSLALLLDELFPRQEPLAVAASVAAACTMLFIFVVTFFFVGQVMAMAALPLLAIVGLRAADSKGWRDRVRLVASCSVLFVILLSHYSHMVALAPPVVIPGAVLAASTSHLGWHELWGRLCRIVLVFAGGVISAVVLVPAMARLGFKTAVFRSDAVAGFPLPGFLPIELMGFMRHIRPTPSLSRFLWSAALLAVFGICAWRARRSYPVAVRFSVATVVTILVSYLLLFRREQGPSYRQWKWITFFQPLFVGLVATTILVAVGLLCSRRWPRMTVAVLCAAAIGFGAVVSTNTGDEQGSALRDRRQLAVVSLDQFDLSGNPALQDISSLNIAVGPFWESMWATYFLPGKTLRLLQPSYWAISQPAPGWTLVPRSVDLAGPAVRPVNASYQLLHTTDAPMSTTADGLGATVDIEIDAVPPGGRTVTGTATVMNAGTSAWVPSVGQAGSVNLGVHLADPEGNMTDYDFARILLTEGIPLPIPPGTTITVPFTLELPTDGAVQLIFQPVAELVSWFGPEVPVTVAPGNP